MSGPQFTPTIAQLPASVPFVGPETQERDNNRPFRARLGANENAFGPSPKALQAIIDGAQQAWMYADPESYALRQALAQHHGVGMEHIVVGEGIDGLLGYLVHLLIEPGDAVITSEGAYPTFNYHVDSYAGALHKVPYCADHEDLDALLAKAQLTQAKLLYHANPNNPMGSWHTAKRIQGIIDQLPETTLMILDEAYIEFAADNISPKIDINNKNVIRMRTFSKAYGLAGMRVGYAIAHAELIRTFDKVRNHFGMNRIAQLAALAALNDQAYLRDVVAKVAHAQARIAQIATEHGLTCLPSASNFVAIDCGADAALAKCLVEELGARQIFVRMPFVAPQNRCIRVCAGRPEDLDLFENALTPALAAARARCRI